MKKAFYVLIVMVVLLGMLPSAAAAKKGTGMYISEINGRVDVKLPSGYRYTVNVHIVDVDGNLVSGARVLAKSNASNTTLSAYTDEEGKADFFIYTESPYLYFTVENVLSRSYIYMPDLNEVSDIHISYTP